MKLLSVKLTFVTRVQYFSLLSHMLEVYPEMVAQLNNEAFNQILGTLDFGLRHQVCSHDF